MYLKCKDSVLTVVFLVLAAGSTTSRSETSAPVWVIDEFVSQEGKWRSEGSVTYVNTTSNAFRGYSGGYVQISPSQFVPFTSGIGEERRQTDQFVGVVGVRYGLTADTEVGFRSTGYWASTRTLNRNQASDTRESRAAFDSLDFTFTHRMYRGSGTSLFTFGSLGVINKTSLAPYGTNNSNFQRGTIGITAYAIDDPVVFSLSSTVGFSRPVQIGGQRYKQGPFISLSPTISFLANERITLSSGLQFSFTGASKFAGRALDMSRSRVQLALGAGYAWNENLSIYANYASDMSGTPRTNSAQLSFIFSH